MKDELALMYIRDGIMYPVALSKKEDRIVQALIKTFKPIKVMYKHPIGKAVILTEEECE